MKNILFDFDGTILENSQIVAFEILRDKLLEENIYIEIDEMVRDYLGWKGEFILKNLEERNKCKLNINIIMQQVRDECYIQG